ncbi:hypothetical protein PGT21_018778 [Puccinia graminis f. sp. tritici]|uniref:Uncharacterized protein n=1 Tax=Puccinia graminis f. sp. tritici TaxID=56615 RepID=A0A5B0QN95_PUCGR|nr:hypothetical protein PGT21_018778 [Puccinia graminis f. sp. tritici]
MTFATVPTGFQGLLSQYALSHQGPLRGRNGPDLAVNSAAVGQTVSEQSSDSQPNLDIPYAAEPIGQELSDPLLKLSDRQITNIRYLGLSWTNAQPFLDQTLRFPFLIESFIYHYLIVQQNKGHGINLLYQNF